ncbi:MAG: 2-amino-4-hydroxy-6-hydroxymethyldihydropteridine diphosphokinase [Armatimonadota bacterium]|jgi:2-amino-4-hydroxy-6-hydroxymethyldihydropteridine diphosphokinase
MGGVFISVGSNISPEINIPKALGLLAKRVAVIGISRFFLTEPLGTVGPAFYNGVIEIDTDMAPYDLKYQVLRDIENALGRVRGPDKYAPRTIDLDVIVYKGSIIDEPDLKIPDPDITQRPFLAVPLYDLAPKMRLPGTNRALSDIISAMDGGKMTVLDDFTISLRKELINE